MTIWYSRFFLSLSSVLGHRWKLIGLEKLLGLLGRIMMSALVKIELELAWMKRPCFLLFGIIKMELEVDAFKPSLFVYGHFT